VAGRKRACAAGGLALALAAWAPAGSAATLYVQDFQRGTSTDWRASGPGAARLTASHGRAWLTLSGRVETQTQVSTAAWRSVLIKSRLAALHLAPADGCYAEVSADGGRHWLVMQAVRRGQDSGVSGGTGAFADPRLDGQPRLLIRFRAELSRPEGQCFCGEVSVEAQTPAPTRAGPLDAAALSGASLSGLSAISAFTPSRAALPPAGRLEGRLTLRPAPTPDGFAMLEGARFAVNDSRLAWPSLTLDLAQDGERLIPAKRGPFATDNAEWEWLAGPGRLWREPGDRGATRAVLPVALEERNANCVHNGRLLILFGAGGEVTRAAVQIDGESCAYLKFDAWSLVPATFVPGRVSGAEAIIARDRAERAARAPLGTLADLAAAYPALNVAALSRAAGPAAVWGLDDGKAHYGAPCPTRVGEDPYCAERALPSYSTAKTLVGTVGLLRLAALNPDLPSETIARHVPACARAGGWDDVRLIDALDMATGHFVLPGPQADEASPATLAFFDSTTLNAKLTFACGQPRRAAPGAMWVYHTADSFLLGAAMTDVIRKAGLGGDLYDDVVRPVWAAIGQSAYLDTTRRTLDAAAQPFTGWGLILSRDDVVRAARFLDGGGLAGGTTLLEPRLLAEAMQRGGTPDGFPALGAGEQRYEHGLWARDVGPLIGCAHAVWAPYLSGYGGISIVLFPNHVRFYAFNDANHFDWGEAAAEIDKIRPMCG
jgi:hypothetical protein